MSALEQRPPAAAAPGVLRALVELVAGACLLWLSGHVFFRLLGESATSYYVYLLGHALCALVALVPASGSNAEHRTPLDLLLGLGVLAHGLAVFAYVATGWIYAPPELPFGLIAIAPPWIPLLPLLLLRLSRAKADR